MNGEKGMKGFPATTNTGVYHRRVDEVMITAVSDGYMDGPIDAARNLEPDAASDMLRAAFRPVPPRVSINTFLVRSASHTALIDTGSGDTMGPTMGRLTENLASIGVAREDIDTVFLTHMHPDHSNGLLAGDGSAAFPNARIAVSETDVAHWHDDAAMARATERQKLRYFQQAREQIAPYRDRLVAPGQAAGWIEAIPAPGHTPGHTCYLIHSGDDAILIWGDTVHWPAVQVPRPEITMQYDTDPDAAAASRKRILEMAASERLLVGGMHTDFPGFGHVVRKEGSFAYIPDLWAFTPAA